MKGKSYAKHIFRIYRDYRFYAFSFLLVGLLGIAFFLVFAFLKQNSVHDQLPMCMLDYAGIINTTLFIRVFLFPLLMLYAYSVSEEDFTANSVLRYGDKRGIFFISYSRIVLLSLGSAVLTVLMACGVSTLFTSEVNNWDSAQSYYMMASGHTLEISAYTVICWCIFSLFIVVLLFNSITAILHIRFTKTVSFIISALMSVINITGIFQFSIGAAFPDLLISESLLSGVDIAAYCIAYPLLTILLFILSVFNSKRKEFLIQ